MIIIGLGTGRCGTASLAKLLSAQPDALCFHEINAVAMRFAGTPRPVLNTIEEFSAILAGGDPAMVTADLSRPSIARVYDRLRAMQRPRLLGDIGYYYLTYVEQIARLHPQVRFVCLRRDRADTIASWLKQTEVYHHRSARLAGFVSSLILREPFRSSRNFWMEHDGTRWQRDEVWDKTMPKFAAGAKPDAIGMYWDYYYETAATLAALMPDRFRVFDIGVFNSEVGQRELLTYCGVEAAVQHVIQSHVNRARGDGR